MSYLIKVFLLMILFASLLTLQGLAEDRYIVIDKATYTLHLFNQGSTLEVRVGYGLKSPLFKTKRGDFLTPEGAYRITAIRPSNRYHYFIELNYPNFNDLSLAYFRGEIKLELLERYLQRENPYRDTPLGRDIGIHGGGAYKEEKGTLNYHWTQGCIALNNADLEILLKSVKTGDSVYIIHSQRPLFEILMKLAYPLRVRPLDFWEGALYLKIDPYTYWYFKVIETHKGKRLLLWEEWVRGRLNSKVYSEPEGSFHPHLEKTLKETLMKKINSLLDPFQAKPLSEWK